MSSRGPYRRHSAQFKLQLCHDIRTGALGRRDAQKTIREDGPERLSSICWLDCGSLAETLRRP